MMLYIAILIGILALLAFPVSWKKYEQPHRYFAFYTEKIHQGNWVPDIFPKDIQNIHEQHNIDTNEVWLSYTPGKQQFSPTQAGMVQLSENEIEKTKFRRPFWVSWWFEGPVQQQPANDNALNAAIYRGTVTNGNAAFFTFNFENNRCYWWQQH